MQLLNADQIYRMARRLLLSKWKSGQGIRLIGLGLYQLYKGDSPIQDSLFSEKEHKKRDLDKVIHNLGAKGLKLKKASELNALSDGDGERAYRKEQGSRDKR